MQAEGNKVARILKMYANWCENGKRVLIWSLKGVTENSWGQYSRCIFSMMVKWANDFLLQANASKMLFDDGEMLVNDGEMSIWSYTHFTIID